MTDDIVHTLVASSTKGRYALDDSEEGHDLTSGEPVAILLGGRWVEGYIEHSRQRYTSAHIVSQHILPGYYFIARDGTICGLCVGMQVRLL